MEVFSNISKCFMFFKPIFNILQNFMAVYDCRGVSQVHIFQCIFHPEVLGGVSVCVEHYSMKWSHSDCEPPSGNPPALSLPNVWRPLHPCLCVLVCVALPFAEVMVFLRGQLILRNNGWVVLWQLLEGKTTGKKDILTKTST